MNIDRFRLRVWDQLNEKMRYNAIFKPGADIIITSDDEQPMVFTNLDNLMACTGLLDKHGTLIYEGDVLIHEYKDSQRTYQERCAVYWDEWNSASIYGDTIISGFNIGSVDDPAKSEIVGHIYQPEWEHLR